MNKVYRIYVEKRKEYAVEAAELLNISKESAVAYLTDFSSKSGKNTVKRWKELDNFLLVKYLDSNIKQEENGKFIDNGHGYPAKPKQAGYPDSWKKNVVNETIKARYLNYDHSIGIGGSNTK